MDSTVEKENDDQIDDQVNQQNDLKEDPDLYIWLLKTSIPSVCVVVVVVVCMTKVYILVLDCIQPLPLSILCYTIEY